MPSIAHPTRSLPSQPDIDQLRAQAKELLEAFRRGDAPVSVEVHTHYRQASPDEFALSDAQLVLARAYGFDSWPLLKAHVAGVHAKAFIVAVSADDLALAETLLTAKPALVHAQWSYSDERRALHVAVMKRSARMVRLLMRHGADAQRGIHPHRHETTAYVMAVDREFEEIAGVIEEVERDRGHARAEGGRSPTRELPEKPRPDLQLVKSVTGGDLTWLKARHARQPIRNMIDWDSGGLLTLAVIRGQREVLAFLLEIGLDPDERVRWSEGPDAAFSQGYPLWNSAATGQHDMAELLLRHGADPNVHVDSSGSPVYAAYSHKQWQMVELLRRHGGIVTPDIIGLYRETELARELLKSGAPLPKGSLPSGRSCDDYLLEYAVSGGGAEIVALILPRMKWSRGDPRWFGMLARGLDFWNHIPWLNSGNKSLDRESYIAGFRLLADRCDPNVQGGFSRCALHEVAAARAHVSDDEVVALATCLLDAGAGTELRDALFASTPLGWACRWGRYALVELLLHRGANPAESDAEPWARPLAWAEKKGHDSIARLLRQHGA